MRKAKTFEEFLKESESEFEPVGDLSDMVEEILDTYSTADNRQEMKSNIDFALEADMSDVASISSAVFTTLTEMNIKVTEEEIDEIVSNYFEEELEEHRVGTPENISNELMKVSKTLKFPAGTRYSTNTVSWHKRGGHAGDKAVSRVLSLAKEMGWKARKDTQSTHPAYDTVRNDTVFVDPEGKYCLSGNSYYGVTADYNSYNLTLTFNDMVQHSKKTEEDEKH
jgi:cupin superfamily acireductone dioxygenase involved in methionine salvage